MCSELKNMEEEDMNVEALEEGGGELMRILEPVRTRLPAQLGSPHGENYLLGGFPHGNFRLVLGADALKTMMKEIGGHLKESVAPEDVPQLARIINLEVCLALAQVVASIPNLQILRIGPGLPDGISVRGGEQAMLVLFEAVAGAQAPSALSDLYLAGHGAFGTRSVCRQLAHLLKSSHCRLTFLELERTGMSADGVHSIAEAMRSNTTLTHLKLRYCPEVGDAGVAHLSTMLLSNTTLQQLFLRDVGLSADGTRHLCEALASPEVRLKTLDFCDNPMMGIRGGAEHLGNMLARNRTLERLIVTNCNLEDAGGRIAHGLRSNRTLTWLELSWAQGSQDGMQSYRELGLGHLFDSLASNFNSALQVLVIKFPLLTSSSDESSSVEGEAEMQGKNELASMLASNRSLHTLSLARAPYSADDWATVILPALGNNQGIKIFNCSYCPGIKGDKVATAFLDLLQSNTNLEEIDLNHTTLKEEGKTEAVKEELQRNKTFRAALSTVPSAKPKSCRIVLCGKEYAGKTTVFQTLKRVTEESPTGCVQSSRAASQLLWQRRLRYIFADPTQDKALSRRTRGIDILLLKDVDEFRICMWDFAGHREFHALHDFIFPGESTGGATVFLFTFSPMMSPGSEARAGDIKTHEKLTEELIYWLRFIVSNTRPGASNKPVVAVAITHMDRVDDNLEGSVHGWKVAINDAISRLATEFRDVVVVLSDGIFVNALDDGHVSSLLTTVEGLFRQKLSELPEQPVICDKVARLLGDPSVHQSPIISTDLFAQLCRTSAEGDDRSLERFFGSGDKGWRAVASYLHAGGELIYHKQLNFIVRNPRWFGHGILGNLIDIFSENSREGRVRRHRFFKSCFQNSTNRRRKDNHLPKNGLVTGKQLKNLLQMAIETVPGATPESVEPDDLIKLMKLLDLCYETNPGDTETEYLLPAIFEDDNQAANGKRPLGWNVWPGKMEYTGWRLECVDPHRTFLTAGFFPRLQVVLHNEAAEGKWGTNPSKNDCILKKYLFSIFVNGMEIYVEYSGFAGFFVDILVKSSQPYGRTKDFVHLHIIGTIRAFCASQKGCQGVTLAEAVIRPRVVRELTLCVYRKDQSVPVERLRELMTKHDSYIQTWREVMDDNNIVIVPPGADDAESLLSKGWSDEPAVGGKEGYPRLICVSRDTGLANEIRSKARFSKAVPFRLHLQCEAQYEHAVQQQPGRTFFVTDQDYLNELRNRQLIGSLSASGFKAVDNLIPGAGIGAVALELALVQLDGAPVYLESIEFLMRDHKDTMSGSEWTEQLRIVVEKNLRGSMPGAWMDSMLKMDDVSSIQRDFGLRKVVHKSTCATSWICESHFIDGQHMYTRVT